MTQHNDRVYRAHLDEARRGYVCTCDPDDVFDPPNPTPRAVEGCTAHVARRAAQRFAEALPDAEHGQMIQAPPEVVAQIERAIADPDSRMTRRGGRPQRHA